MKLKKYRFFIRYVTVFIIRRLHNIIIWRHNDIKAKKKVLSYLKFVRTSGIRLFKKG